VRPRPDLRWSVHPVLRSAQEAIPMHRLTANGKRIVDALSPRHLEILLLLSDGRSVAEIAKRLKIATTTTRNHIQAILHRIGVHTKLEAVVAAFRGGVAHV